MSEEPFGMTHVIACEGGRETTVELLEKVVPNPFQEGDDVGL